MSVLSNTRVKPIAGLEPVFTRHRGGLLQRKCACGSSPGLEGECEECHKKHVGASLEDAQAIQRRSTTRTKPTEVPPIVYEVLRSPGQPLDAATRAFFEPRFGHDFSQVRVHTDSQAAGSARAVNALAYTVGRNIVFSAGQYNPNAEAGERLLAHELTHVIQQGGTESTAPVSAGRPDNGYEYEAERVASRLGTGGRAQKERVVSLIALQNSSARLQRLGTNPTCTKAEAEGIHQAIYDARGWLNKAIPKLEEFPLSAQVVARLRRNFGPTYGVAANASLIRDRLKAARLAMGSIPYSCDTAGATPLCIAQHCGWAAPGSNAATICTNPPSTLGLPWPQAPACMLHESLHASMGFMAVDRYKGEPGYPGVGTEPLRNPDSYTSLAEDLS